MSVETILEHMEDLIEEGKATLVGGKTKVDADALREDIQEIRLQMPDEIIQARKIAAERKEILIAAQKSAEDIIHQAEAEARRLVDAHEITSTARVTAADIISESRTQATDIIDKAKSDSNEIIENANKWSKDIRTSAGEFVDTIMRESDEILSEGIEAFTKELEDIRKARQQLKNASVKKSGQY
ncbi:MAG: hypothetical protein FWF08_09260 [Oscillospiraceae bacterium]|nr:hypothetical protein [Oscillospiraceae bacterium]